MAGGSAKAVYSAIAANGFLTVAKFVGFIISGSASMLSEAIHSFSDTANQSLLAIGMKRSGRPPSTAHPYGYGRELYVWVLVSAVGIFFLGCGLSLYHGVMGVLHPHEVENRSLALIVLAVSAIVEGWTLWVAVTEVRRAAKAAGVPFLQYVREGSDPLAVAVLLEDGAAELGVLIAAACLGIATWTGDARWDAAGSIVIGLLLGFVAIFLIVRSSDILIGRSADDETTERIRSVLDRSPFVEATTREAVTILGPDHLHYKVEVDFNGHTVAEDFLAGLTDEERAGVIEHFGDLETLDRFFVKYGDRLMDHLGCIIDEIEGTIQELVPAVKHVDLEVHSSAEKSRK